LSHGTAANATATEVIELGPRSSMAQRVADALAAKILDGTYKLGERLIEADLIKQLDVSNSVVREAFLILQGQGIVVADPYRGRRVFNIANKDEYVEMLINRVALESLSASLAVQRLDPESEQKISQAAARCRSATPTTYVQQIQLELDFHKTIWAAAKNDWAFKQLNQFFFPSFSLSTKNYPAPALDTESILRTFVENEAAPDHWQGHQRIARAILNRDAAEARKSMIFHILAASNFGDLGGEIFGV